MNLEFRKRNKGFTLIELLVVIAIIGLLASIVTTALSSARVRARDARRLSDVKQIKTGLDLFFSHGNGYPTKANFDASITSGTILTCGTIQVFRPVQDPLYPTAGFVYTYTETGGAASGCGGVNNLIREYEITFVLEKTGVTYTMDSDGQFSPAIPSI